MFIDGLRGVAATYVVLHHAILQYYEVGTDELAGVQKLGVFLLHQGQLFVDLFIVISGFCLMRPVIKAGYRLPSTAVSFYIKRAVRILPSYFIAMVLSLILIWLCIGYKTGTHWDVSIPVSFKDILSHALLYNDVFKSTAFTINHSFWSISVEARIYLLFPLIVLLWRKLGAFYTLIISLLTSALIYQVLYFIDQQGRYVNLYTPGFAPYVVLFIQGLMAADVTSAGSRLAKLTSRVRWGWVLLLSLCVFIGVRLVINGLRVDATTFTYQWINITFGLFSAILLIVCALPSTSKVEHYIQAVTSWKPLAFLGTFAYSTYLIHAPLLQVLTQYVIPQFHLSKFNAALLLLFLSLVVILPCSYIFYLLFEVPFAKLLKKTKRKQQPAYSIGTSQ